MVNNHHPSVDYVRQCLRYEDGKLFWLVRPSNHFPRQAICDMWNSRWSTHEAGSVGLQGKYWVHLITLHKRVWRRSILVWVVVKGEWPFRIVDHENRNTLDDKTGNLRLATQSQNIANSDIRKDNTTGFKGVSKFKNKYKSTICCNQKIVHLGLFDTAEEAHEAYLIAAKKYFGEFACDGK